MDLPTCPSCGQSVLDDDAVECPFCGAAMDGSSKGKPSPKPPSRAGKAEPSAGKAAAKPTGKPAAADSQTTDKDDDPFGLTEKAATHKTIPCAPRPTKSRTLRVRCPMCETVGFVPKGAVGRQVKCPNPKCMVPIFTVPDPEADTSARVPARVSEEALAREEQLAKPKTKNPLLMYGIIGGVLLVLAIGLVMFLNAPGEVNEDLDRPITIPQSFDDSDDVADDTTDDSADSDATDAAVDIPAEARRLADAMVTAARQPTNNRDKPYCRQLTADAYLRLGERDQAATEFTQLQRNSRAATYYRIEPYLRQYWQAKAAGNAAAAAENLEEAREESGKIPPTGRLGLEAAIALAAALTNEGEIDAGLQLIEQQQRDQTVTTQLDDVRQGTWFSVAAAVRDNGLPAVHPVTVFAWNEPLKVAVAVELASQQRWQQVVTWSQAQQDPLTASDILAAVAAQAVAVKAPAEAAAALHTAAKQIDPEVGLRVAAVLGIADQNQALRTEAQTRVQEWQVPAAAELPDLAGVIRMNLPDLSGLRLQALGLADTAAAAAATGNTELATTAIVKLHGLLASTIPPTAAVRQAVAEMEASEDSLMQQLRERFALRTDNEARTQFRNYRRSLDRLAAVAEERRLFLVQLLHRVVLAGGAPALQAALTADNQALLQELALDPLSLLLVAGAVQTGQQLPQLAEPDQSLLVPAASRIPRTDELSLAAAVLTASTAFRDNNYRAGLKALEDARGLPGFRAAVANALVGQAAATTTKPQQLLTAIQSANNPLWREDGLHVAGLILTRRQQRQAVVSWLSSTQLSATEKVVALHGVVSELAKRQPQTPAEN